MKRKPEHTIKDLSFEKDWCECECGIVVTPSTFAQHRDATGAARAWSKSAIATDASPPFMARNGNAPCRRSHVNQWRVHEDGRRTCRGCAAELEQDRRDAETVG